MRAPCHQDNVIVNDADDRCWFFLPLFRSFFACLPFKAMQDAVLLLSPSICLSVSTVSCLANVLDEYIAKPHRG